MLYYQMPFFFFLGAMLYLFPGVAKTLGITFAAFVIYRFVTHRRL